MNRLPYELRVLILTRASAIDDRIKRQSIGRLASTHKAVLATKLTHTILHDERYSFVDTGWYQIIARPTPICGHTTITYKFRGEIVREEYVGLCNKPPWEPNIWRYRNIEYPYAEDAWQPGQLYDPLGFT